MNEHKPYGLTTPCNNCPFRTDVPPYIRSARVREIQLSLVRAEFPCHKTTKSDDEGGQIKTGKEMHCAGALILMQHEGISSQMTRIMHRLRIFDPTKLDMEAPVYTSFDEMHEAHVKAEKKREARVRKTKSTKRAKAATR